MNMEKMGNCRCGHHIMVPLFIGLIGLTILLGNLDVLSMYWTSIIWPSLLAGAGFLKVFSRACKCCGPCRCCTSDKDGAKCC